MKIGIDLGNSVARAAYLNEQGIPTIVPDFDDPSIEVTPAVIHVGKRGCLIGDEVESLLENEPGIGVARHFCGGTGSGENLYVDEEGQPYESVHLVSLVLRKLVQDAEKAASDVVEGAVLALPADDGDERRALFAEAAEIAGIPRIEFCEASRAVLRHYRGAEGEQETVSLVYDLGHTSFSAEVIREGAKGRESLGKARLSRGGGELNGRIVELVRESFRFAHGFDPMCDPVASVQLRHCAEETKRALSERGRQSVHRSLLICGRPLEFFLSRRMLARMAGDLIEELDEATQRALAGAGLEWKEIDRVLLSGGNCALDLFTKSLLESSGLEKSRIRRKQPDFAVAFGAAHLTGTLDVDDREVRKRSLKMETSAQVLGKDLVVKSLVPGSRTVEGQVIIRRDAPLPARREFRCLTSRTDQERVCFHWELAGEGGEEAILLGETVFDEVENGHKGYPLNIAVNALLDGTIEVEMCDPRTGARDRRTLEYRERREISERDRMRERLQSLPINT